MLPLLLNTPQNARDFDIFSFINADNHAEIIRQIAIKGQVNLAIFPLDPIPLKDTRIWLEQHQQMHNDMNAFLGTSGSDLADVDFNDKEQLVSWIQLHFVEHLNASNILGLG